jgi:hypothetical protein
MKVDNLPNFRVSECKKVVNLSPVVDSWCGQRPSLLSQTLRSEPDIYRLALPKEGGAINPQQIKKPHQKCNSLFQR